MKRNIKKRCKILKNLWQPFFGKGISLYAAAACYYILLSLLPFGALLLTALPLLPPTAPQWLNSAIPTLVQDIVTYFSNTLPTRNPTALLSFWAILGLWSASKGVMSLITGLCAVMETTNQRGFFARRFYAMVTLILLIIALAVLLLGKELLFYLPINLNLHSIPHLQFLLSPIPLIILFALMYGLLPGSPLPIRTCLWGGVQTAAVWITASAGFSFYVNYTTFYQNNYGGLGLLVLACLWLQICISVFLYSARYLWLRQTGQYHPLIILKRAFF